MTSTLNSLTAQVLTGQITCGAYADAVHAFQSGKPTWSSVEGRGDDSEDEDEDEDRGEPCKDCGGHDDGDCQLVFACEDCYRATCTECAIYFERAELHVCPDCAHSGAYADEPEFADDSE